MEGPAGLTASSLSAVLFDADGVVQHPAVEWRDALASVLDSDADVDRLGSSATCLGFTKPDPRFFRAVLDVLPYPPDHLLFIDDRQENVAAARDAGIRAILFQPPPGSLG